MHDRRSLSGLLALCWLVLIVYASLYPFTAWRLPPGAGLTDVLRLPWPRWLPGFDAWSNLLGYLPLGLLLGFATLRARRPWWAPLVVGTLAAAGLSYGMELLQQFVPRRVPSAHDWLLNTGGGLLGALLAVALDALGWPTRWRWLHDRWLQRGGSGATTLLLLWPVGLLFPSPLPFGLGQVGGRLRELALDGLDGVSWAQPLTLWLETSEVFEPASAVVETVVAVLGLLAPCLLAYAASAPSWRRAILGLGVPAVAITAATLSTALNFGPEHAFAWRTPTVDSALVTSTGLGLALVWVGPRLASSLALIALTGLVLLVHLAPADPYFAQSLQAWEQGRFIRFHGLAQWVGWLWPYLAIGWLLAAPGRSR